MGGTYTFKNFQSVNDKSVLYGDKIYVKESNNKSTELSFLNISGTAIEANVFNTSLACKNADTPFKGCHNKYIFKENKFNNGIINIINTSDGEPGNLYMVGGKWDFSNNKDINNNIFDTTKIYCHRSDSKVGIRYADISFDTILDVNGDPDVVGGSIQTYKKYYIDSRTEYYSGNADKINKAQTFKSSKGKCS